MFVLVAQAATHPTAPTISAAALSASQIQLTLVTPSTEPNYGIGHYRIYYSTISGSGPFTLLDGNALSFPYLWSGVSFGTQYWLEVSGVDNSPNQKESPFSSVVTVTTPPGPQVATPTFNPVAGTYSGAQSVAISCSGFPSASIFYTTDGSTPTTGSTAYSGSVTVGTTETLKAIGTELGYSQSNVASGAYTINAATAKPFPRFAVSCQIGGQLPTSATLNAVAQYPLIMLGGNSPYSVGGSKLTRDQIVTGLKGQTLSGKNSVKPIVIQYENLTEINPAAPWAAEWYTVVNTNNWWVYNVGSSGTKTPSQFNAAWNLVNMSHNVPVDGATGLYPYQWAAQYVHDRYITGGGLATGTIGAQMASSSLDGVLIDNMTIQNLQGNNADWLRNGTSQASTDPTATLAVTAGKADASTKWATIDTTRVICGNTTYAYDTIASGSGGLGLNGSNINGKFAYAMQQFVYGNGTDIPATAFSWGGAATAMTFYKAQMASVQSGSVALVTGGFRSTDYQLMRAAICSVAMDNGYMLMGGQSNLGYQDQVDGSNVSTLPLCDEMWGGTQALGGYLGAPLATSQGAVQTAAWQNGVWRRDFANGIVLMNMSGASQTVTLGGTYYHLRSAYGSQPINNAAAATSVTLAVKDGCILMNNPT